MSIDARRYSLFGLLSVLGLLGCTSVLVSQSIEWEQYYAEPIASEYGGAEHHVLRMPDGGYVITGQAYHIDSLETAAGMIRTDAVGNVLWKKRISDIDSSLVWPEFAHGYKTEMYPRFSFLREDGKLVYFGGAGTVTGSESGLAYQLVIDDEAGGVPLDTIAGWYDTTTAIDHFGKIYRSHTGGFIEADSWLFRSAAPDTFGNLYLQTLNAKAQFRLEHGNWYHLYRIGTRFEGEMAHYPVTVLSTPDNGFLVWGAYQGGGNPAYLFLLKVDSLGNREWAREPDGLSGGVGVPRFFDSTADGGFVGVYTVVRNSSVDTTVITPEKVGVHVIKFDAEGNTEWTRAYPDAEGRVTPYCIRQAEDRGYVVCGTLGRFDSAGKYLDSSQEFFLLKVDSVGNEQWRKVWGTPERDRLLYMIPGPNGSMMVSGPAGADTYFAQVTAATLSVREAKKTVRALEIEPNPSRDRVRVAYRGELKAGTTIQLYDVQGRSVYREPVGFGGSGVVELDVSGLPAGTYRAVIEEKSGVVLVTGSVVVVR